MKKIVKRVARRALIGAVVVLAFACRVAAQQPDYKVIFDLTSRDTADHNSVIRWIREITATNHDAQIEVVLYGGSLGMVLKGQSTVSDALTDVMKNEHVQFDVCSIAMRNHHITKENLIPGVGTVPDGIYEIISKQRRGWGYIKAAH